MGKDEALQSELETALRRGHSRLVEQLVTLDYGDWILKCEMRKYR